MARGTMKRYLSMCLVVVMLLTTLLPVSAYAADDSAIEDTATNYEEPVASELEDVSVELEDQESEQVDDTSAVTEISDYATFLSCFKVLEGYAQTYAEENAGENVNALIINYIRTGVERYTSGTWEMVCGKENTAFTAYVSEQDTANNTSASALKNLGNFTLPNGNKVDLGHVFGAMDVANYAKVQGMTDAVVQARADMGSWAGDITDLMYCAENVDIADKVDTTETDVDTLAANIRARYLGVDYGTLNSVDHSFTDTDLYGDMDAFYLTTEMNRGGVALSTIIENYFTAGLTDASRASYFLTNRLDGMVTKDGIRSKVMSTYTGNTLIGALESSYSLTDLSNYETLRKACCYAFADYLFDLAGDPNGTDPVDPDPDPEPDPEPDDAYYSVFSSDTTTVAPGVTQTINYALTKDDKQIVYYIATADISRDDVSIHANYHANDPSQGWAMSRVSDQMTAAQKRHSDPADTANYVEHYNAVVGVNADFYNMTTGAPSGALVMEGVEYHSGASANFFAILKDGTAMIGSSSDYAAYKDQIQEAVGGSVYLVKDGKSVVTSAADYYNSRHSRTCVGITAEGKVVLMVLDGRQEPFSAGGSAEELAQIMLDAGCVTAINLDGGGSTTFVAKQEGSNTLTVVNRPSDGYERSVSSSLMVVSTAPVSTEFDHALITSAYKAVGEAVQQPLKYYRGNLDSTLTLLETMGKYQVKNLIFSSSATVYGNPSTLPITEACPTGNIASPYGWTKYMIEQIITDYAAATLDFSAVIFRYFNPVGAHPSGLIGEAPNGTPNNLMPYITQVAMGKRKQLSVFGADYDTPDGTCIRDYIHIMDIAAGHTAALPFCTSHHGVEVINLGTGMGHSVLELISAFESATGVHIPFQIVGRRAGDIPVCFASAEKAKALLGWQATRTLSDMCRDAWNWQQKNPDGFI